MRPSLVSAPSCCRLRADLELLDRATGGAVAFTPEQRVLLALVEADAEGRPVNVKYLETHYSGARSSFQLFLARLVEADVARLRADPRDRRSKLVVLSPTAQAHLGRTRAAAEPSTSLRIVEDASPSIAVSPHFATGLETWLRLRGDLWVPALSAVETIALSSRLDIANAHVVERTGETADDFRFLHMGAIGAEERRRMSSNLLSSLPDDDYRRAVFEDYRQAFEQRAPVLETAVTPSGAEPIRYRRLVLPFRDDCDRIRRILVLIDVDQHHA